MTESGNTAPQPDDVYQKAYKREKLARLEAEKLLDTKTREVHSNIEMIQLQVDDLLRQKKEVDYLLVVANLIKGDKDLASVITQYLRATIDFLDAKFGRYTFMKNESLVFGEMVGIHDSLPKYLDHFYTQLYNNENRRVHDINLIIKERDRAPFETQGIERAVFIPIKSFGTITTVCEIFISQDSDISAESLNQCQLAGYQIGGILESNESRKKLEQNYVEIKEKNNELKNAQSQLVQSEKMASLGLLAAGVAHEINNPIGFVMSNIGTLKEYTDVLSQYIRLSMALAEQSSSPVAEQMKRIDDEQNFNFIVEDIGMIIHDCDDGLDRIKDIVANLKSFSRSDEKEVVPFDINLCIDNTIKLAWNELKYKVNLTKSFAEGLPKINGHESQIGQVIMNIVINAAHAIDEHGDITIETKQQGNCIKIIITDTGNGMPLDIQEKIFDPFFTTKSVNKGTGLGLSISYGIIENHGGEISLSSEVGKGTVFEISLPC